MTWSGAPYDEGTWSGGVIPNTTPPGQVLAPPIPGATKVFTWGIQQGVRPWSYGGWAGGTAPAVYTGGGVVVATDPDSGTATIYTWWPYAGTLQLIRITEDGTRTPVRGAFPVSVVGGTRVNLCPNPSANAGLNGYVPGAGVPTLSTITRTDLAVSMHAWRATIASAGTNEVTVPASLPAGQQVTIGVDLQFSGRPAGLTITVGWVNTSGTALASSAVALTANQVNISISQFGRQVVTVTPPAGASTASTVKVTATGMAAGATMDGSRVTIEQGATDGSPYDGDSAGGQWTGVAELSTSILAPVQTVVDGECPLDVPVSYQVYDPAIVGGWALSIPVILASNDQTWLTHPTAPARPVLCHPTKTPVLTHKLPQAIMPVIGRARPVVVSASTRLAPSGDVLSLDAETFDLRNQLTAMFSDGQPMLLRAPADYGFGPGQWIALGDLTEDPGGRPAPMQTRTLSASYQEVDPPAAANLIVL